MKTSNQPRIITAYKHGWPRIAVQTMIRRKLRSGLFQVRVQGLEALRSTIDADPRGTLFLANHSCWWDLFLVVHLNDVIPVDGYGMMEHFNMLRFDFFRRIGAFSVDRTDPASVRASLEYTSELLHKSRAGVWIFPQGRMIGNDVRPLGLQPGIRLLVKKAAPIRIVPVAFRFEFWQDERPEAFVRFGSPEIVEKTDSVRIVDRMERRLTEELDELKLHVTSQDATKFTTTLQGAGSISDRYARFRSRFRKESTGPVE